MHELHKKTQEITDLIVKAAQKARKETDSEPEPAYIKPIEWPVDCIVGPGLEGAIACESKIGYVNGSKGWLVYRGYDIFDLCAHSTFEEVSYLLLHGTLPTKKSLVAFKSKLVECRNVPDTIRVLSSFSLKKMHPMSALSLGSNLMRQEFRQKTDEELQHDASRIIGTDEDSIPMETTPRGEKEAIYEFKKKAKQEKELIDFTTCYRLISGVSSIAASISRIRQNHLPIEYNPELSHAANLIYMMTGKIPTPEEERIMDVCLILHADHGMNASTFASMVVASTLSDIYFSIGSGIAALYGPLHGGANEQVLYMLDEIGDVKNVKAWFEKARKNKKKIMGFGHRVYKAYDPRARVLSPLADYLTKKNKKSRSLFKTAKGLEKEVISTLGTKKGIFPNVDFYSGIVYEALGIPTEMFTPIFAVSRVSGWTARVMEYVKNNRIFRPRAMYTGPFNKVYTRLSQRSRSKQ